MEWIGKNLSLGGLVRHAGNGLGTVTNITAQSVGVVASLCTDDPKTKKNIKDTCSNIGKTLDSGITKGTAVAGQGIDYGVQKVSVGIGYASGSAAKLMGASEENVILAKKVGTVVGAVGIGVVAGGGMAAGQAVVNAIVATGGVSGAATIKENS